MNKTPFRPDINGLRAVSVLAVMFFHAHVLFASGGFIWVDVFGGIFGFMMTQIICEGLEKGNFGWGQFHRASARRIVPALGAGAVYLLRPNLRLPWQVAKTLGLASVLFSNYFFDGCFSWPAAWTLLPTLDAAMMFASKDSETAWATLLTIQLIATTFYSIYFWHWPVIAAVQYYEVRTPPYLLVTLVVASMLLGLASSKLIECRLSWDFFDRMYGRKGAAFVGIYALTLALATAGVFSSGLEASRSSNWEAERKARTVYLWPASNNRTFGRIVRERVLTNDFSFCSFIFNSALQS